MGPGRAVAAAEQCAGAVWQKLTSGVTTEPDLCPSESMCLAYADLCPSESTHL